MIQISIPSSDPGGPESKSTFNFKLAGVEKWPPGPHHDGEGFDAIWLITIQAEGEKCSIDGGDYTIPLHPFYAVPEVRYFQWI